MPYIHNNEVARLVKTDYKLSDLQNLILLLQDRGTLTFSSLDNGLFPAAQVSDSTQYTGYAAVWVRDNIYVAHSHYLAGKTDVALKCLRCLMQYFSQHQQRFTRIIDGEINPDNVMQRPHIRFNGADLAEINQDWQHAQNDALGYFLWFYCRLIADKALQPSLAELAILTLFPLYFKAIAYWQDEDSGHWEEDRKIAASSIGVVVASLKSLRKLFRENLLVCADCQYQDRTITLEFLDNLIQKGIDVLATILPSESIQPEKQRRYDAALLFLIYPLDILDDAISNDIIADVIKNLQGKYGISRYLDDSFWCRNYSDLPENIRTSISTDREQWLEEKGRGLKQGEEAQWCIFEPIISAIYGVRFQKTQQTKYLEKQTFYLNRSLGQLTATDSQVGGFKCPELYFLNQDKYIPNDATPLLWTQANLYTALKIMEQSLSLRERSLFK
ncbi:glycoside hydrolase family 15 protein [Pleurocapsa sp. FMAR1]|uniref:glycoside hydrolase family 15 protein n=1 Tax=Pleurocapsa sp. FMAR1 TaxID=3040204 RepID=UPI0029C89DF7|nr:glycoside hydrolase family 15 protein [Pleurocapsa sp. FMAR1]